MTAHRHHGPALVVLTTLLSAVGPSARGQEPAALAAQPPQDFCRRADFRVVLDVGHTVKVPGAMSARGAPEYTFNLQLAQETKAALVAAGFVRTELMITSKPPPMGLFERAFHANAMAADLFIAIHHDSVPDDLLQKWEYNGQPERFNDNYSGYGIFVSEDNAARAASLEFGKLLGAALQARGLGYTPHYRLALMRNRARELLDADFGVYRYDQLVVLKETHMPAVLLEAGSIVNREDELALASPERRALESAAITSAVEEFCAARESATRERVVNRAAAPNTRPPARRVNATRPAQ
jgi:N-acetylmuramoyl-L-alanine amidase